MELSATGEPPTHGNLPAAKALKTRPRCTLQRSEPPAPPPSLEIKLALTSGAMVHVIVIQQRSPRLGGRRSLRQETHGRSPQGFSLSSAKYTQWYLPPRVTCPKLERTGFKGRVQTGEDHQDNYRARHSRVLHAGDMAPWVVFNNNPRTPPDPPWNDNKTIHRGWTSSGVTIILGLDLIRSWSMSGKTTSHHLRKQLRLPRPDDWCHPLLPQPTEQ